MKEVKYETKIIRNVNLSNVFCFNVGWLWLLYAGTEG